MGFDWSGDGEKIYNYLTGRTLADIEAGVPAADAGWVNRFDAGIDAGVELIGQWWYDAAAAGFVEHNERDAWRLTAFGLLQGYAERAEPESFTVGGTIGIENASNVDSETLEVIGQEAPLVSALLNLAGVQLDQMAAVGLHEYLLPHDEKASPFDIERMQEFGLMVDDTVRESPLGPGYKFMFAAGYVRWFAHERRRICEASWDFVQELYVAGLEVQLTGKAKMLYELLFATRALNNLPSGPEHMVEQRRQMASAAELRAHIHRYFHDIHVNGLPEERAGWWLMHSEFNAELLRAGWLERREWTPAKDGDPALYEYRASKEGRLMGFLMDDPATRPPYQTP